MVPAAVGPPKTRLAVPGGNMKLMSGVSLAPVQLSGQPGAAPGARAIQLPSSVSKPGGAGGGVPGLVAGDAAEAELEAGRWLPARIDVVNDDGGHYGVRRGLLLPGGR